MKSQINPSITKLQHLGISDFFRISLLRNAQSYGSVISDIGAPKQQRSKNPNAPTLLPISGQVAGVKSWLICAGGQDVFLTSAQIRPDCSNAKSTDQTACSGFSEIGIRRRCPGDAGSLVLQPNGHFSPVSGRHHPIRSRAQLSPFYYYVVAHHPKWRPECSRSDRHAAGDRRRCHTQGPQKILGKSESALSPRHAGRGEYAECLLLPCPASRAGGDCGHYHRDNFLDAYIELMTAEPPQHPDTYAESYHRVFLPTWTRAGRLINAVR